mgnify:CR=1 FL=1|jgi:hypothetical protein|tara:strand:+ start:116 stop:499 length:384 start_codon:yes stop_codon:yes gene_type:complete
MDLPTIVLPNSIPLETISIPLPTADVPSYIPMVVPPSDLREPEGTKPAKENTEQPPPQPTLNFPPLPPIPIPSNEVLITTSIAAVTAVAATTFTQPIIENIKKKLQKFLQSKINKWKEKKKKDSLVK